MLFLRTLVCLDASETIMIKGLFYIAVTMNTLYPQAKTKMNLTSVTWSERNQTQKNGHRMNTFM